MIHGIARTNDRNFGKRLAALCVAAALMLPALGHAAIEISVRTIGEDLLTGNLLQFSLEGGLVLQTQSGGSQIVIPTAELVRISRPHVQRAPRLGVLCIELEGGDKLFGSIVGSSPDQLVLDTVLGEPISIPLERVRACLTAKADQPRWQKAVQRLSRSHPDEDRVLLSNGDVLRGFVLEIGPTTVQLERQDRQVEIALDVIIAIALAAEPRPAAGGLQARLEFVDGSTLTVPRLRWSPEGLDLSFFDGTLHGLPPETVHHVELRGTQWVWLDGIEPVAFEHTPMLSLEWSFEVNRDVAGGQLAIGGQIFERGIGVHSRSTLKFILNGQYREFSTACGLDDSAGALADVTAAIFVDGELKWREKHIKSRSPPMRVRVDVRGARSLELRVEFGDNGDLQDRFNWADAALIR
jgi:hypothetical protein